MQLLCTVVYGAYLWGGHIPELEAVANMFKAKYGRAFSAEVNRHPESYVQSRILKSFRASGTAKFEPEKVEVYLHEIAKLKGVEYVPVARPVFTSAPMPSDNAGSSGQGVNLSNGVVAPPFSPSHTAGTPDATLHGQACSEARHRPAAPAAHDHRRGCHPTTLGRSWRQSDKSARRYRVVEYIS